MLMIGRRALVALGLPPLTRDLFYYFWIDVSDVERVNDALLPLGMRPTRSPDDARASGRYAVESDEHADVLVARTVITVDGEVVAFEDVWNRHVQLEVAPGVMLAMPSIDDFILTKKFGARPRDADDIRWLERLKATKP